ncbi:histone-lysine N-methyltransferase, H3 lysine-9 specific SUVH4 isoform X2 [Rosa chinensis]|uniref:histone-lysine N-methyltransferase, H3 lysine-9 specific SUVH4 isoform X2 n=1 Tax=Rosa chinensis TaxID=74649 RepID=UPI001AD8C483|nr:histone-lysine N-methyltransferase, H3 lysine-9 specific SUVH4 isoform X2 [Rosa chinensis]
MAAPKDSVLERRVSLRLQYAQQKPFYGTRKRTESEAGPNGVVVSKKPKVKVSSLVRRSSESGTKKLGKHKADDDDEEAGNCESGTEKSENGEVEAEESGDCEGENKSVDVKERDMSVYAPSGAKVDGKGKSYVAKLKETLRLFNLHYLHFVQEEEKRCRKLENESECRDDLKKPSKRVDKKAISENGNGSLGVPKKQSKRPDLKALSQMSTNNEILYPEKTIGHLPGIEVGQQFFSRAEMVVVGFHSHWLNGIDIIGKSKGKDKFKGYTLPIAVAIVLSGQYEDDVDNSDEIVYTGQGGNDLLGNKRQIQDQVMRMGNLALKVHHYWAEKGVAGFTVFKYRLKRLPGQPKLISNQVLYTNGKGSKAQSELPGLVCKDICNGLENIKVPVTNIVDIPPVAPEGLTYITTTEVAKGVKIPPHAHGCNCQGNCTNSKTCSCAQLNGGDFPYVSKDGGRLVEAKAVVFECGPQCGCGPSCVNRASQRGLKYRLEVFRTHDKGWAVRSWDFIPSGAPVCEYIAVLRRNDEIDNISEKENEYVFEIDCWQTMNGIGGREKRMGNVAIPNSDVISESDPEYCYDAGSRGNVARYINHSCEPNLFVQCVLREHHDVRLARIVLFAADNIPPLQELSYDYGYELDSVVGPDGKIKKLFCRCGAAGCRKRLY